MCIVARRRWCDGGIVVGGGGSGATYPTNVTSTLYTYIGIELHGTKGGKHEVGSNGEKYAWASLHSYTYLVNTLQPEGLGADTKSICMVREQPKNAVLCLVGYFKIMIMRLSYWKGNINFHTFTCNTSYQNCNQFSNKIGLVKKYRSCGPVGHVKYLAL